MPLPPLMPVPGADKNLPDIVLADLGPQQPLLIFVEVVATDGPVTSERKAALSRIALDAGFLPRQLKFVTAFLDRNHPAFKKAVDSPAWGSFAWFASEPDQLIVLAEGKLSEARRLTVREN